MSAGPISRDVRLPLATSTWDDHELMAIRRVIESGQFTMSDEVHAFEMEFASYLGARYAVMVNSGSSANLLAVATAVLDDQTDLNRDDEVLVPAVAWSTTYFPLIQYGLRPVLVDIDPNTLNLDVGAARAAVTDRTKAVMAVNLLGNPNEFDSLTGFCRERGLLLLEDNCESLGATYDGRQAGTFGRLGTFSFYFSHHISTVEGGAVVTDDERYYHILLSLRSHGWTRGLPADSAIAAHHQGGFDDLFQFILPGYNLRPLEFSGAIGRCQLGKLDSLLAGRRRNAAELLELMRGVPGVRMQTGVGRSSWFGFSMVLQDDLAGRRGDVIKMLTAAGVETRPIIAGNFAHSPVMSRVNIRVNSALPVADEIHQDGFFVGNNHQPMSKELAFLADSMSALTGPH